MAKLIPHSLLMSCCVLTRSKFSTATFDFMPLFLSTQAWKLMASFPRELDIYSPPAGLVISEVLGEKNQAASI